MGPVHTVGHGTLSAGEFAAVLEDAGVDLVVDVRRYPGSHRHPHFAKGAMEVWLPEHGIGYCWLADLGGRRQPTPDSVNVAWRNAQFRAYADHMATAEFAAGVKDLKELDGRYEVVAVMCSESVWWRCHRRLLADHLVIIEGIPVVHIFHDGRLAPHEPGDGVRRDDGHLTYPADNVGDPLPF